ncbi:MAG: hypothetical protein ABIP20_13835 [Chthoniobacteraceae bacterium]
MAVCRRLNELGARYLVCGGFAIIHAGYARFTGDIDLLVDASLQNEAKVYSALEVFPDKAVRALKPGEISEYTVVRVGDEVTVDLMASASGIGFDEAEPHIVRSELQGVSIPFASPLLLWRMKCNTHREKDRGDLYFLRQLLESQGITPPE